MIPPISPTYYRKVFPGYRAEGGRTQAQPGATTDLKSQRSKFKEANAAGNQSWAEYLRGENGIEKTPLNANVFP